MRDRRPAFSFPTIVFGDFRDKATVAVGLELTDHAEHGVTEAADDWIRISQKL